MKNYELPVGMDNPRARRFARSLRKVTKGKSFEDVDKNIHYHQADSAQLRDTRRKIRENAARSFLVDNYHRHPDAFTLTHGLLLGLEASHRILPMLLHRDYLRTVNLSLSGERGLLVFNEPSQNIEAYAMNLPRFDWVPVPRNISELRLRMLWGGIGVMALLYANYVDYYKTYGVREVVRTSPAYPHPIADMKRRFSQFAGSNGLGIDRLDSRSPDMAIGTANIPATTGDLPEDMQLPPPESRDEL
ncbi:hypothetical protein KC878_04430 [Candidatus Saccharibacteria bacterium]|nr:hypothetical protein [Candidatus Saccharibacteria bacterium]MCB9821447.1 hypothetical protein [Candidatus Nomurabacteria bacterium]